MSDVLLIDNYDSFVFNLARYLEELGASTVVRRNDEVTLTDIETLRPAAVVLSPGPGTPEQAGICIDLVRELGSQFPILGVCLGHQAIAAALGGSVIRSNMPVHGRTSLVHHDESGVFRGCPSPLQATRYHSLVVEERSLPHNLRVTARTTDGMVMGLAHRSLPIFGVQFHPESILSEGGHRMLANFLEVAGVPFQEAASQQEGVNGTSDTDDFYQRPIIARSAWNPLAVMNEMDRSESGRTDDRTEQIVTAAASTVIEGNRTIEIRH